MTRRQQFGRSLLLGGRGHSRDLPFLFGRSICVVLVISYHEIIFFVHNRTILALSPCCFCLVINNVYEIRYVFITSMKYIFPDKLCSVCCSPGVATTSTDERLTKTFRVSRNVPSRVFCKVCLNRKDRRFTIDRSQRVNIP
jgi:hypothetical protein